MKKINKAGGEFLSAVCGRAIDMRDLSSQIPEIAKRTTGVDTVVFLELDIRFNIPSSIQASKVTTRFHIQLFLTTSS